MPVYLGVQQYNDDKVSILICRLFEQNKYKFVVYYGLFYSQILPTKVCQSGLMNKEGTSRQIEE